MNPSRHKSVVLITAVLVVAFGALGLLLALVLLGAPAEWVFTTKPLAFASNGEVLGFLLLFSLSTAVIPLSTMMGQHFDNSTHYRALFPLTSAVWFSALLIVTVGVRLNAGRVHASTLTIPEGLVRTGLLVIPAVATGAVLLLGCFMASRYETRT